MKNLEEGLYMKNRLYSIDEQGNLKFSLRSRLNKEKGKPESIWEHQTTVLIIMTICCILDTVMFFQLFNSYLSDDPYVRMLSIIAMLIGFDVAPILIGVELRKRNLGLRANNIVIYAFGIAFIVAFLWNIVLRIATKDLVLPDNTMTSSLIGTVTNVASSKNKMATVNALFAASLPVITSLVSFGVSFYSYNPVRKRLNELKAEQIQLEDSIVELEALLLEYESDPNYWSRMLEDDEQKYLSTLDLIQELTIYYCDYVRERIKEHLGDPASSNELSKNQRKNFIRMINDSAA